MLDNSDIVRQPWYDFINCGPCCVATVLNDQRAARTSYSKVRNSGNKSKAFWNINDIRQVLHNNRRHTVPVDFTKEIPYKKCFALTRLFGIFGHWVLVWRLNDHTVEVFDPYKGVYQIDDHRFLSKLKMRTGASV